MILERDDVPAEGYKTTIRSVDKSQRQLDPGFSSACRQGLHLRQYHHPRQCRQGGSRRKQAGQGPGERQIPAFPDSLSSWPSRKSPVWRTQHFPPGCGRIWRCGSVSESGSRLIPSMVPDRLTPIMSRAPERRGLFRYSVRRRPQRPPFAEWQQQCQGGLSPGHRSGGQPGDEKPHQTGQTPCPG